MNDNKEKMNQDNQTLEKDMLNPSSQLDQAEMTGNNDPKEASDNSENETPEKVQKTFLPIGLTMGMVAGIIFGEPLLGSTSRGMALGICLGLLIGAFAQKKLNQ